jgi:hypothetical protein
MAHPDVIGEWIPKEGFRLILFNFINSNVFEICIMIIIMANVILMAISYEGSSIQYD